MNATAELPFRPDLQLASRLFSELERRTGGAGGITRASYGEGEAVAHGIIAREARRLGMRVATDAAMNLYMTLPGIRQGARIMIGSHLDSVPAGGNFDGAAGVIMGLSVAAGMQAAAIRPPHDLTVMAIRAEESAWFNASYIGSRAAFGCLSGSELDAVRRIDDGLALGAAIDRAGGSSEELRSGKPFLDPAQVGLFIEPHIEQGDVLVHEQSPVAVATGIRGSLRFREARCLGAYAHSGTTRRRDRRDAVLAVARLTVELERLCERAETAGGDLAATVGQFSTDPKEAAMSKVAGRVDFSVELRSLSSAALADASAQLAAAADDIAADLRVRFEFGAKSSTAPTPMDAAVTAALGRAARRLGVDYREMPCGAGHDASVFQNQDVPSGMILIRNRHGSHNPAEHMDMADFEPAALMLASICLQPPDWC